MDIKNINGTIKKIENIEDEYSAEEIYYGDRLYDFYNTMFFDAKKYGVSVNTEWEKLPNEEVLNSKEFIDYLIQLEKDQEMVYSYLYRMANNSDAYLGKILELNVGPHEGIAALDEGKNFDITVVSDYASSDFFGEKPYDYYNGHLEHMVDSREDNIRRMFLKYNDIRKNLKQLNQFDTILNINPISYTEILETYLYGLLNKKSIVTGFCTSLYDNLREEKLETMKKLLISLKRDLQSDAVYSFESHYRGSDVFVLSYLRRRENDDFNR